jgi:putative transposase
MDADISMQNDLLNGALGKKALRPSRRREMAINVVIQRGASIALACSTLQISETCYLFHPGRSYLSSTLCLFHGRFFHIQN